MMKISLIYPGTKKAQYGCFAPITMLHLATLMQQKNFETTVFDLDGYLGDLDALIKDVVDFKSDLIGIAVFSEREVFVNIRYLCSAFRLKSPGVTIVLGGPHVTACPEQTLDWFPQADFALRGETDYTLPELAQQLQGNAMYPKVSGLSYRHNGAIVSTPRTHSPQLLDDFPITDRKFLWDNYKKGIYWRVENKGITDILIASRGCPFSCKFCFKTARKIRFRSPENVVQEMEYLASLGITSIHILDELFTANKQRTLAICKLIREAKLKLNLKVRSRVDTVDEEVFSALRRAGVTTVVYGIESGSQTVLDNMGKRTTVEMNYRAIRIARKYGFRCYADMLVGFPGETKETIEETKNFVIKAKPFVINIGMLIPYPATPVYDEAKKNGTLIGDWASVDSPYPYVNLPDFASHEVLSKALEDIQHTFFFHPVVIFRHFVFFLQNICNGNMWKRLFGIIKTYYT